MSEERDARRIFREAMTERLAATKRPGRGLLPGGEGEPLNSIFARPPTIPETGGPREGDGQEGRGER
jgi:hypothetical protein